MNYSLPAAEDYEKLIPVVRQIYEHNNKLCWEMLLPMFLLSVAFSYTSDLGITGAILVRLKRLVLVVLLLVSFPMIAEFTQIMGVEIAKSIDNMAGIDLMLQAAKQRAEALSFDINALFNIRANLIIGALTMLTFILLVIARFFLLAFQHFYWLLLVSLAPFMILGSLYESASGVTKSLFKNMIQVACWPVIWAILSAFLKVMPFANVYYDDGSLISVITLNLLIAVALLFSPFLVSQLCEGVSLSVGDTLRRGALKAVTTVAGPKGLVAKYAGVRAASTFTSKFKK